MIDIAKKYINRFIVLGIGFVLFSFILGIYLSNGLVIFLSWNMVLALMVYVFSSLTVYLYEMKVKIMWIIPWFILWILFFPNAFYILTDTIHFQNYGFFEQYPDMYHLDQYTWLVYFDITIGALIALKIGLISLEQIKKIIPEFLRRFERVLITMLFILSSIGIYLGRFIRLNSWNILNVFSTLEDIFAHIEFFIVFVFIFTCIHLIAYYLFKSKSEL